jgi:hypothetical protein
VLGPDATAIEHGVTVRIELADEPVRATLPLTEKAQGEKIEVAALVKGGGSRSRLLFRVSAPKPRGSDEYKAAGADQC